MQLSNEATANYIEGDKNRQEREHALHSEARGPARLQVHVLVEAAPDAVLLLSFDERARILFANDQCGHLLRLDFWETKGTSPGRPKSV